MGGWGRADPNFYKALFLSKFSVNSRYKSLFVYQISLFMGVDGWIHKFGTFVPNKSCYYFEGFPKMMLKQFLIEQSGVSGALVQGAGGETSLQF